MPAFEGEAEAVGVAAGGRGGPRGAISGGVGFNLGRYALRGSRRAVLVRMKIREGVKLKWNTG